MENRFPECVRFCLYRVLHNGGDRFFQRHSRLNRFPLIRLCEQHNIRAVPFAFPDEQTILREYGKLLLQIRQRDTDSKTHFLCRQRVVVAGIEDILKHPCSSAAQLCVRIRTLSEEADGQFHRTIA